MPLFTDLQIVDFFPIANVPLRVVSLVPSLTELLFDLGLDEEVVGITKFCVHPETWFRTKTRIGGTKNINAKIIHFLQPGLIIANKEENLREQVEDLAMHYPVWVTDIRTPEDALKMIRIMGKVTGKEQEGLLMAERIEMAFEALAKESSVFPVRAAYFIWRDPYMVAGGDTFIHAMMNAAGFRNAFADRNRYPAVTMDELRTTECEYLLLSSEPYPFKKKHVEELQKEMPAAKILLVDGEMFSWYGSRMRKAVDYLISFRKKVILQKENLGG